MKKLIFLIFFVLVQFAFADEGWIKLNSPTDKKLEFVDFLNKDFGVIGGDSCLFITTDGGINFKNITINQSNLNYLSVLIDTNKDIFISGIEFIQKGTFKIFIKKTTNYGISWDLVYSELNNFSYFSQSIQLCNENVYNAIQELSPKIVMNHYNLYLESNYRFKCNGEFYALLSGKTDSQIGALKDFNLQIFKDTIVYGQFNFTNPNICNFLFYENSWFVNDYQGRYKSWDNGKNWNKISNLSLITYLGKEFFYKQDTGYFYIWHSQIYKSNDCINLITCKVTDGVSWINSLKVVDKNIAYAVGDSGLILKTTDGGGVFTDVEEEIQENQEIKITSSKNSSFTLELKYLPSEAKLELINILGVPLFSQSTSSQILSINLEQYPTGIYLLKYTDKHSTQVFKLLRE